MKLLFGIMSAVQPRATVTALCDAIGPDHQILVHHDFTQQADFAIDRPQVSFVDRPARTGWGTWGFLQGIVRLVEAALERDDWEFLQLLSPTCLPIRPIRELQQHLRTNGADYYVDAIDISTEDGLLMSHGWRAFAVEGTRRHRVLRRSRRWYLGNDSQMANRAGLSFPQTSKLDAGGLAALKARIALAITRAAQRGIGFDHIFDASFRCYAGSTWFTANRRACRHLLTQFEPGPRRDFISRMHMPDEMYLPSVFLNSPLQGAAALHVISRFDDARPAWIEPDDLDAVLATGLFFARKFPEAPDAPVRLALARRLAQPGPAPVRAVAANSAN